MINESIIEWLLKGDPSIQYQVYRDLLDTEKNSLRELISTQGWGVKFLSEQNKNGHWGEAFYQPKWISTHYTLLDLKNLCISPNVPSIKNSVKIVLLNEMNHNSDTKSKNNIVKTDICVNGMVLNYASYFNSEEKYLSPIVDYLLLNQMKDGGFNCHSTRVGSVHSSLHTTLSVLEGLYEFRSNGNKYRRNDLVKVEKDCIEFILQHRLYKSDKTGEIINKSFTMLPFPSRWKYDILRCLDFFQYAKIEFDARMQDAITLLLSKRRKDGFWPLQAKHPGRTHSDMEKSGQPSRWNTLRALRVLKHFNLL